MTSSPPLTFRDVLYQALAGPAPAVRDAGPLLLLTGLLTRTARYAGDSPLVAGIMQSVLEVARQSDVDAALQRAQSQFATPPRFAEALYFLRCLDRDREAALRLLMAVDYLQRAAVPENHAGLHSDREAVLATLSFASLWQDASRLEWLFNAANIWRRAYVDAYVAGHARYHEALGQVSEQVDRLVLQAGALERLNRLRQLGPPLAAGALEEFRNLERLFACHVSQDALRQALETQPLCRECSFRLGDEPPSAESLRVLRAVERGLASQQARLAQRVVSRLLLRPMLGPEDRLNRFVQVVHASDVAGLALVLDDSLVDFLRELLEPQPRESGVLEQLVDAYPEVSAANLDAATAEFRRLLQSRLAQNGGRVRLRTGESPT